MPFTPGIGPVKASLPLANSSAFALDAKDPGILTSFLRFAVLVLTFEFFRVNFRRWGCVDIPGKI
jgi:hypothetical protein